MKLVYFDTLSILLGIPLLGALVMLLPQPLGRLRALIASASGLSIAGLGWWTVWRALDEGGFAYQAGGGFVGARLVGRLPFLGLPLSLEPLTQPLLVGVATVAGAALVGCAVRHERGDVGRGALGAAQVLTALALAMVVLDHPAHLAGAMALLGALVPFVPLMASDPRRSAPAAIRAFVLYRIGDAALVVGLLALNASLGSVSFEAILAGPGSLEPWARIGDGAFAGMAHRTLWFIAGGGVAIAAATRLGVVGFPLSRDLTASPKMPGALSGLLVSLGMITPGVALLLRLHPVLSLSPEAGDGLMWAAAASTLAAGLLALAGRDLLRLDAHLLAAFGGLVAILLASPLAADTAVLGALVLLGAGLGLPWVFALLVEATGRRDPLALGGLEHRVPRLHTSRLLLTAAVGLLPPFSGWVVVERTAETMLLSPRWPGAALALMLSGTFLTALAAWRVLHVVFTGPTPDEAATPVTPSKLRFVLPVLLLAFVTPGLSLLEIPAPVLNLIPLELDYEGPLRKIVAPSLNETRPVRLLFAEAIVVPPLKPSQFAGLMLAFGVLPYLGSLLLWRRRRSGGGPPLGGLRESGPVARVAGWLAALAGRESQVVRSVSEQVERLGRVLALNLIPAALSVLLQRLPGLLAGGVSLLMRQTQTGGAQRQLFLALIAAAWLGALGLGR